MATLKATFYTHGYTQGCIFPSWLHLGLHLAQFYTHGNSEGYILHSWLHSLMATFCTHGYTQG